MVSIGFGFTCLIAETSVDKLPWIVFAPSSWHDARMFDKIFIDWIWEFDWLKLRVDRQFYVVNPANEDVWVENVDGNLQAGRFTREVATLEFAFDWVHAVKWISIARKSDHSARLSWQHPITGVCQFINLNFITADIKNRRWHAYS